MVAVYSQCGEGTRMSSEEFRDVYDLYPGSEPDHENLTVEIVTFDGLVATLYREPLDKEVKVRWPVDEERTRSSGGRLGSIINALERAKAYIEKYDDKTNN